MAILRSKSVIARCAVAGLIAGGTYAVGAATSVSAVCVSGVPYWTSAGWAQETPTSGTCDGDRVYRTSLYDPVSDGYEARIQGRRTDLNPSTTSWMTYATTNRDTGLNPVTVTFNDKNDTVDMQLRLCQAGGSCAVAGTNTGH